MDVAINRPDIVARFWKKVNPCGPVHSTLGTECWLWTRTRTRGYGIFAPVRTRFMPAHRYSLALRDGGIPQGMSALHRCDVRHCVRPDHLFWGTYKDNTADMIAKGRQPACMKVRTHCKRGHEMAISAIPVVINGKLCRRCGQCSKDHAREYARTHRDEVRAANRRSYRKKMARPSVTTPEQS